MSGRSGNVPLFHGSHRPRCRRRPGPGQGQEVSGRPVLQDIPGAPEACAISSAGMAPENRTWPCRAKLGTPVNAVVACHAIGTDHFVEAIVARQHVGDFLGFNPPLSMAPGRPAPGVADIGTVAEIAFEQRLDDAVLDTALAGQANDPMGTGGCWACGSGDRGGIQRPGHWLPLR